MSQPSPSRKSSRTSRKYALDKRDAGSVFSDPVGSFFRGYSKLENSIESFERTVEKVASKGVAGVAEENLKSDTVLWIAATPILLLGTLLLALVFPRATAFLSTAKLYSSAWFKYEYPVTFDDSILTWGTDYIIAAVTGTLAILIGSVKRKVHSQRLVLMGVGLLGSYSVSTFAGAICHNFLVGKLHTGIFRFFWRVCVGAVATGGAFMLGVGSSLAQVPDSKKNVRFPVPVVPNFVVVFWGLFFFTVQWVGMFSMKQPACDIFMMGVTQTLPTVYICAAVLSRKSWKRWKVKSYATPLIVCGCLTNILLLPYYDVVNFFKVPVGITNLILHTVLLISWSCQGLGILEFAQGISRSKLDEKDLD